MSADMTVDDLDKLFHDAIAKISGSFTIKDFNSLEYMDTIVMSVHQLMIKDKSRPMYDRIRIIESE